MEKDTKNQHEKNRPPIVVVLGHVDHGKTTLLDKIRQTNVAPKEKGGITQSIGASVVTTKEGKKITFIDTPGHAVFSKMRSQGAKSADLAILVVAADDGVKPQTKEAIRYIKEEKIPVVVAATKSDLPSANVEKIKPQIASEGILLEGQGGDTPVIPVSGKTGAGVEELLEMVTLVSEMNEISSSENHETEAVVIETSKSKRGPLVSVIVRNGNISVGDTVFASGSQAKVKGLFDENQKSVKSVGPGFPCQILGFNDLPAVGASVSSTLREKSIKAVEHSSGDKDEDGLALVIKAQSMGSLEAIKANLPDSVFVVSSSVGDVTDGDIFLAKSAEARIFVFESKVSGQIKKLAKTESVIIEEFGIIYKLFERIDELIKEGETVILGKAEILAEFPFDKRRVAGSRVKEGRIARSDSILLQRNEKDVGYAKLASMRKEKKEVDVVKQGEEFGVIFDPYLDFMVGDVILSVRR